MVEEYVVQHESTHGEPRPLATASAELCGDWLRRKKEARLTRRGRAQGDLGITPALHVTQSTTPHRPVVEVDRCESSQSGFGRRSRTTRTSASVMK